MEAQRQPCGLRSQNKKRKTLHDFFSPSRPSKKPTSAVTEPGERRLISEVPGLSLFPNFVTKDEQRQLLTYLDALTWRTDLQRRTIHFGGTYCYAHHSQPSAPIQAPPIPIELQWIIDRMIQHGVYQADDPPTQCIINEYVDNNGISAHVDKFEFDEPVCSLTLGNGDYFRMIELVVPEDGTVRTRQNKLAPRTGRVEEVFANSGSLLVMNGPSRWTWQHEIARSKKGRNGVGWRRVSLTWRVPIKKGTAGST